MHDASADVGADGASDARAAQLFALGCPAERPAAGASCTCGCHLFGEASSGRCAFPCAGGTITATCIGDGGWSSGPGAQTWTLSSCDGATTAAEAHWVPGHCRLQRKV